MLVRTLCAIALAVVPLAQAAPVADAELDTRYIYTQHKNNGGGPHKREDAELDARYIYTQHKNNGGGPHKREDAELDARYIYTKGKKPEVPGKREDDGVFHPAA